MSQENVEVVRRLFAAFQRGDMAEMLDLMSDDHVTHRPDPQDTYYGKEGYLAVTADWNEQFAEWSATGEEFIDAGDKVVVRDRQVARGDSSGAAVEGEYWFVYTVAHGKTVRLDMYIERRDALEAVELTE